MEYQGKSNAALATGIIGTTLGGLLTLNGGLRNGNGGWGLFGNNYYNEDHMVDSRYVSKEDLGMAITLAQKDSEIALLKSEQNTEVKIADVYERLKRDMLTMERNQNEFNASQMVFNANSNSAIAVIRNQIDVLNSLTKTVVPITNVCPEPMPLKNSWTAPTTAAPTV